jgi:hypothetical protein
MYFEMLRKVVSATPSFSAGKTEAREALNQVQNHLLGAFRVHVFWHFFDCFILMGVFCPIPSV